VGDNLIGSLIASYATGSVSGTDVVGGLVGWNYDSTLTASYATGSVSGTEYVGGLVGINDGGILTACYSTCSIDGNYRVGGLVGYNYYGKVIYCFSTGKTTGTSYVGGLCGQNTTETGNENTGNFWDIETSEVVVSAMGIGKTTAEMMTLSTFTDAEWDFTESDGDPADWMMLREGEDYPRLAWQTIYPGDIAGLYGVDIADLTEVIDNWLRQDCPTECEQADIDSSGTVDLADLSLLAADWMK
jgi:hypothetical protein